MRGVCSDSGLARYGCGCERGATASGPHQARPFRWRHGGAADLVRTAGRGCGRGLLRNTFGCGTDGCSVGRRTRHLCRQFEAWHVASHRAEAEGSARLPTGRTGSAGPPFCDGGCVGGSTNTRACAANFWAGGPQKGCPRGARPTGPCVAYAAPRAWCSANSGQDCAGSPISRLM